MHVSGFICTFAPEFTPYEPCEAVKVWAMTLWNSVLQRFVFGLLNLGNSSFSDKNIAEWMLRVVYNLPLVCREVSTSQAHFTGVPYITAWASYSVCFQKRFS